MFEVVLEPEFSAWFEALPAPLAEAVATAIDLAASTSSALVPERSSRLLIWYDGSHDTAASKVPVAPKPRELPAHRLRDYVARREQVARCLRSEAFMARLGRLEGARAAQASALLDQLELRLREARLTATYQDGPWVPERFEQDARVEWQRLHAGFVELLVLMGLESQQLVGSGSGLREITVSGVRPSLRVLFGLDFPSKRLIAILGEALDKSYYGDSVKAAEVRWQDYLASRPDDAALGAP